MKFIKELADGISKAIEKLDCIEAKKVISRSKYDVTRVIDEAAEKAALRILETQHDFNLLTEETGYHEFDGNKTILLDPIDGSFNAVAGIPFYAVSIAIGSRKLSDLEYGFVRNLATRDEFEAGYLKGAYFNNRRITTKKFDAKNVALSVYLGKWSTANSYKFAKNAKRLRFLGCASLDMCFVAAGIFDAYHQDGYPLRITDIAAGTLILREARGEVYDIDNIKVLEMNFNLSERRNVLAVGDKKVLNLID